MAPVLRSRKSVAPPVTPAPKQQKPKGQSKAKQKPENAAPGGKFVKSEVGSHDESADEHIAHRQGVHQPPPLAPAQPLRVSLMPDAQTKKSGNSGPPFTFQYDGITVAGGTFEQRAGVIMAFLDRQNSSGNKNKSTMAGDSPRDGGESVAGVWGMGVIELD